MSETPRRVNNRIDAEQTAAASGATFECRDPADARRVTTVAPQSGPEDVAAAVAGAETAAVSWAETPAAARAKVLEATARILEDRENQIAAEMVGEMGKPLAAARGEVGRSADNLRLYAAEALRLQGRTFPVDGFDSVSTMITPLGVVGVITPWNFPLSLASRKIGPALAAGNSVVFKPSPHSPGTGDHLADALATAGLPPGVLQTVHGFDAGAHLVADARLAAVTFTGSTAVGRKIHQTLDLGRRAQLELGGNNPVVVLADADLDRATAVVARSAFALSGQACTAAGRVIVDAAVHDELLERTIAAARKLVVGSGLAPDVDMGPLIDETALMAMDETVARTVGAGARLVIGGERLIDDELANGWFYPPTILTDVAPETDLACTETFGPVIGFERVTGFDEAIASANQSEYGLTASVCTRDISAAYRFTREIQAGIVRVNRPTVGTPLNAPFGGVKLSGTGMHKEQLGPTVMDFYTQTRTVFMGA